MAKLIDPLHSLEAHGKVGGLVYRSYHGNAIVSALPHALTGHTGSKNDRLRHMSHAWKRWLGLEPEQRKNWAEWARQGRKYGPTDAPPRRISGYNAHNSIYVAVALLNCLAFPTPPDDRLSITITALWPSQQGDVVSIDYTAIGSPGEWNNFVTLWIQGPHSAGRHPRMKDSRRLGSWTIPRIPHFHLENRKGTFTLWGRSEDNCGNHAPVVTASITVI